MPKVAYSGLVSRAGNGVFARVYFFHGEEKFLTGQAVDTILGQAVDQATRDFNFDRFHGADLDASRLATVLSTPPMMAPRRVVLIRDLEKVQPRVKQYLTDYAENPADTTVLVLAAGERIRIDQKKKSPKWAARLEEAADTVLFWPLREAELIRWIVGRAQHRGKSITARDAFELYIRAGGALARLDDELEKLSIFCGERPEITADDIRGMTGIESGGTVFDWVDHLAEGGVLKANELSSHLVSHGESAVNAVALAGRHFMTLGRIREMLAQRIPDRTIKLKLGLIQRPAEAVQKMFGQARALTPARLERALELLLETDLKLKSSRFSDRLILEELGFRFQREVLG
ncbi:MAG: DNA polymerase III subunit delta [Candidatus Glassbacteria bacterium]|nr:DNA polymerase III subunit delta [Candidatus Glassbacteria bacterium]